MSRFLLLLVSIALTAPAANAQQLVQPLTGPWAYRWGDLPPPVGDQRLPADGWTPIEPMGSPAGDSPDHILWLRIPVTPERWTDPAVWLGSVGGPFEAYSGGGLVYSSGVIRPGGRGTLDTMSWHIVELNPGPDLILRIQPSAAAPAVTRGSSIGSRADLAERMLQRGVGSFVVALLLLFMCGAAVVGRLLRPQDAAFGAFAVFALTSAAMIFGFAEMSPLLVSNARFLNLLLQSAISMFGSVFAWCLFTVVPALAPIRAHRVVRALAGFGLATALVSILDLPMTRLATESALFVTLGSVVIGVGLCMRQALRGDPEARVLALGFAALFVCGTWDSLPTFGLRAATILISQWGFLCVVVSFAVVLARRSGQLAETLEARTNHLEERQREVVTYSRRMETSAGELAGVVAALRESSDVQTRIITRQAASVQETQVSSEEIKRTSALAAEKAGRLLQQAVEADEAGKTGDTALKQSLSGLEEIGVEVGEMARRITAAGTRAQEIASIVATVKDLADQSNMLALNAAIEAVRSGEAGRGFSLVAKEVRRLADESLRATARIKGVLHGLGDAIEGAVAISESGVKRVATSLSQVRESGDQLQRLSGIVQQTSGHVRQISSAVTQQNAGVTQIVAAIGDLSRQVEETLDHARGVNAIAGQVQDIVSTMRRPGPEAARAA